MSIASEPAEYGTAEYYASFFRRHAAKHGDLVAVALVRHIAESDMDAVVKVEHIRNILAAAEQASHR